MGELNIIKMSIPTKLIYDYNSNQNSNKIIWGYDKIADWLNAGTLFQHSARHIPSLVISPR